MCFNPIIIRNKYKFRRTYETYMGTFEVDSNDRNVLRLPCGKCEACLNQKKDDFYLRCRNEYFYTGKRAVFQTLTYRRKHIPKYTYTTPPVFLPPTYSDTEVIKPNPLAGAGSSLFFYAHERLDDGEVVIPEHKYTLSVWDKSHIQKYLKALNEYFIYYVGVKVRGIQRMRNGKITPEWHDFLQSFVRPLRYLVVCERGNSNTYVADNGKTRVGWSLPHYHILLFPQTPEIDLRHLQEKAKECWLYGNSYPLVIRNAKGELVRDEMKAIKYVCKYVTKQGNYDYKGIKMSSVLWHSHEDELRHKPFILTSNFLGIGWLDNIDYDYVVDSVLQSGVSDMSSSGNRSINLPTYYLNKIRYKSCKLSDDYHTSDTKVYDPKIIYDLDSYTTLCRYDEVWDFSTGSPVFVGWEYHPPTPTRYANIPTEYHERIAHNMLHSKGQYYATLLTNIQLNDSKFCKVYFKSKKLTNLCTLSELLHYFKSIIPDDFYLYIVQDLDTDRKNDIYQIVYDALQMYSNYLSKRKYIEMDIKYKASLSESIKAKPELFNVHKL